MSALIVGATGKQGGAVVKALLARASKDLKILALTRDKTTARAQALESKNKGRIEVIEGNATDPKAIFAQKPPGSISSLYFVTVMPKEEPQGIPLIDAALAHGVKHLVFSSVDRGGEPRSWDNPTNVTHFYEKHNIEVHLRDAVKKHNAANPSASPVTWSIIRPAFFMDNLQPGFLCGLMVAMWYVTLGHKQKLQLVATRDIGIWAAKALMAATGVSDEQRLQSAYADRAISLAGDELNLDEVRATFKKVVGKDIPWSWSIWAYLGFFVMGDLGKMFEFFKNEGYGADIKSLRSEQPDLANFETWLKEDSNWLKK